jgi:hypothetical protein
MAGRDRGSDDVESALRAAIEDRRVVVFVLEGCPRVAEPHDCGVIDGRKRLLFYQIGGVSRSRPPVGWRWADLLKISGLRLLDRQFEGARPAPSGRHRRWDRLIASVSRPPTDIPRPPGEGRKQPKPGS